MAVSKKRADSVGAPDFVENIYAHPLTTGGVKLHQRGPKAQPQGHVGGGVVSAKKPQPDLAVSMKQMLRRKGGTK